MITDTFVVLLAPMVLSGLSVALGLAIGEKMAAWRVFGVGGAHLPLLRVLSVAPLPHVGARRLRAQARVKESPGSFISTNRAAHLASVTMGVMSLTKQNGAVTPEALVSTNWIAGE